MLSIGISAVGILNMRMLPPGTKPRSGYYTVLVVSAILVTIAFGFALAWPPAIAFTVMGATDLVVIIASLLIYGRMTTLAMF